MAESSCCTTVSSSIANIPWKTPASLLQEMCVKKGFSPEFVSVSDGDPHDQIFVVHAVCGELRGIGIAKTKKVARQIAARHLIENLITGPDAKDWPVPNVPAAEALSYVRGLMPDAAPPVLSADVEERPGGEEIAEAAKAGGIYVATTQNHVGELMELIKKRRFKHPDFKETDKGPSHLKDFTCKVTVGNFEETATAKQKKEAKQLAASLMLARLQAVPENMIDVLETLQLTNDEEVCPIEDGDQIPRINFHTLKELQYPAAPRATAESLEQLMLRAEKGKWGEPEFQRLKQPSKSGKVQMLVQLVTKPERTVSYGEGETELEAKWDAAANVLQLISLAETHSNGTDAAM